jgi:hypothetical protein
MAGLLGSVLTSRATLYEDLNTYGTGQLVTDTTPFTDSFHISYNTPTEHAVSGVATFLLADIGKDTQQFSIDLGSTLGFDSGSINDLSMKYGSFQLNFELAGGLLSGVLLGQLDSTGTLQYTISATSRGWFSVLSADLLVNTDSGSGISTRSIPDGGLTVVLLGGALLGLGALRRRF